MGYPPMYNHQQGEGKKGVCDRGRSAVDRNALSLLSVVSLDLEAIEKVDDHSAVLSWASQSRVDETRDGEHSREG